jgi:putative PIN family toxin of toxin-antitoxin system
MRVVLDANVLGPGLLLERGTPFEVVQYWRERRFEVVVSEHLVAELSTTLNKPYWRARFASDRIQRALLTVRRRALRVIPTPNIDGAATHWQDDIVIASAIAGNADYLVTGDKELLAVKAFRTVSIVSPQEFLNILKTDNEFESGR